VACQLAADNTFDQICINGKDVTSTFVRNVAANWDTGTLSFEYPGDQPGRFTVVVNQAYGFPQDAGFLVSCSYPANPASAWNFVSHFAAGSPWRAILANSPTSRVFDADVCSMNPSNQLNYVGAASSAISDPAAVATGTTAIWTPVTRTLYTGFTYPVASLALDSVVPSFDADSVYFTRLVRPLGMLDPTPFPTATPSTNPSLGPINQNLSASRVMWFYPADPLALSSTAVIARSTQDCPGNSTFSLSAASYRYLEFAQAQSGALEQPVGLVFYMPQSSLAQTDDIASALSDSATRYRFFGAYLCRVWFSVSRRLTRSDVQAAVTPNQTLTL